MKILLSFPVSLAQFAPLTRKDSPGHAVSALAAIELAECGSTSVFVVEPMIANSFLIMS